MGAGVAGLLAAYHLDRAGFEVTVLEAEPRAGGLIRTTRTESGLTESAAHSLLATPAVQELCADLAQEDPDAALVGLHRGSSAKFIWRRGRRRRMPLSPLELLGMLGRMCCVRAPQADAGALAEPETIDVWARRHLGPGALAALLNPLLRGVYGARPQDLCVAAVFPALATAPGQTLLGAWRAHRRRLGKRPRGPMSVPKGGMGALVGALARRLERRLGARFQLDRRVVTLPDRPNVVLAVPTREAATLLGAADPALSSTLLRVPYTPIVSVTAFVARTDLPGFRPGVGVLVPEDEGRHCLGILYNSSSFPGRVTDETKLASFTIMMGGTSQPHWLHASDHDIRTAVADDLSTLVGATGAPVDLQIHRWERAIPQYGPALMRAWAAARTGWCATPGHLVFGNHAGEVSLRGMIESAQSLGDAARAE